MSPDDLNVKIETTEEQINVDNEVPASGLTVDPISDLNVTIETKEIKITADNRSPEVPIILNSLPDVIVLPTTGTPGPPGPAGPEGPSGPAGTPGPPGESGAQTTYIFTQLIGATIWDITHNLDCYPSVTVVDTGGSEIIPTVIYVNNFEIQLYFQNPTTGKAYLN